MVQFKRIDTDRIQVWHDGRFIACIYAREDEDSRPQLTIFTKEHGLRFSDEGVGEVSVTVIEAVHHEPPSARGIA